MDRARVPPRKLVREAVLEIAAVKMDTVEVLLTIVVLDVKRVLALAHRGVTGRSME